MTGSQKSSNVRLRAAPNAGDIAYQSFLMSKSPKQISKGLKKIPALPDALKPFQRDIVTWALRMGRAAVFAGTGLGKTITQLSYG